MNVHMPRQLVTGAALAGALAFVAACSSPSSSLNPTSPSAAAITAAGANILTEDPPPDPCGGARTLVTEECETLSGRFTGGGFQINTNDVRVTRGFTIHCDNLLTNNLEVNWAGGNNFHMDKNRLTNFRCTRPVGFEPTPPASPVSRIVATSSGSCNGVPGASITFTLEDHGEPGRNDMAALSISGPGCGTGLALALAKLDGGNIQAHFDQPHRR